MAQWQHASATRAENGEVETEPVASTVNKSNFLSPEIMRQT